MEKEEKKKEFFTLFGASIDIGTQNFTHMI